MSESPDKRNSAGRLLWCLNLASATTSGFGGPQWSSAFSEFGLGPKASQSGDLRLDIAKASIALLTPIRELYDQFRDDVAHSTLTEEDKETVLDGLKSVERFLYPHSIGMQVQPLNDAERSLLRLAGRGLPEEREIREDELEEIRTRISRIRELLGGSNLSSTARKILMDVMRVVDNSVQWYQIHGARGFKSAFESMLGEMLAFYYRQEEADRQQTRAESWFNEAWGLIVYLDAIAARLLTYQPLIEPTVQRLLH